MYKLILTLFLIVLANLATGQNLDELEKRHGFKGIKLEAPLDTLISHKFKKDFKESDEFDAKLFVVDDPAYTEVGEVKIRKVEVKTYKDIVYEISVTADKDPRLMKALESLFGKSDYDMKSETYFWRTKTLTLKYRSSGKNTIEMIYTSLVVHKTMKDDKNQKVNEIANDF